jgi:hypothetical protein
MRAAWVSILVAASGLGCSTSSTNGTCPKDVPCGCTCPIGYPDSGDCVCDDESVAVCPESAAFGGACVVPDAKCMGCTDNAGFSCTCSGKKPDAGGASWACVGTEYVCSGGN